MAWFSSWKIGFQKSELKGHVVAFSKQAERYTAIFQFPHHATGSPNSQVSSRKHHLPLEKYMFCINKIEIQGRTKELQTHISGTAPQQLIVQGKLISWPRRHYYSTILTFFFFDFSDDDCGTSEVVLLCTACA